MTAALLTLPPEALPGYEACIQDVLALLDRVAPHPAITHASTLRLVLEDRAALLPGLGWPMPEDNVADAVAASLAEVVHVTTPPALAPCRPSGDLRAWTPERVAPHMAAAPGDAAQAVTDAANARMDELDAEAGA